MPTWRALEDELDRWGEAGLPATFWWRDDDAGPRCPALERLLDLRRRLGVALAVAAVPAWLEPWAIDRLAVDPGVDVLQHGRDHVNRSGAMEKKCEFPEARPIARSLDDLRAGSEALRQRLGDRVLPVLAPPWNRIPEALAVRLGEAGFMGLSGFGPRPRRRLAHGLVVVNTHVDVIAWRGDRGFVGEAVALAVAVGHLQARRLGESDRAEPTGLLTHHRDHDAGAWRFVEALIGTTARHPAARWLGARALFEAASP
jgi:peptidoglycan/xylan/chitin deacetylase (PgdA/CDA1 family)